MLTPADSGRVADLLLGRPSGLVGRSRLLTIDGPAGSGKTSLAGDAERVLRERGAETARWQRYDWSAGRFDGWVELPAPDVLVLERCGAGARGYDAWTSLLVWLEAASETRVRRGMERDGGQVRDQWLAWMPLEEQHFAANDTRSRADVRLST